MGTNRVIIKGSKTPGALPATQANFIGNAISTVGTNKAPDWLKNLATPDMQTTTQKTTLPDYMNSKGVYTKLNGMTGASMTAGYDPMERRADANVSANVGAWKQGMNQAGTLAQQATQAGFSGLDRADALAGQAATSFADTDMSQYVNPHLSATMEQIRRTADESRARNRAGLAGMGLGANSSASALAATRTAEAEMRQSGQAAADAFDRGVNTFFQDRQQGMQSADQAARLAESRSQIGMQGADQAARLAATRSELGYQDAAQLRAAGESRREHQQGVRDREMELTQMRLNALQSSPERTVSMTTPGPSVAGQQLGALMTLSGLGVNNLPGMPADSGASGSGSSGSSVQADYDLLASKGTPADLADWRLGMTGNAAANARLVQRLQQLRGGR